MIERRNNPNQRQSILEQWEVPIGFAAWFFVGFVLLHFNFYSLAAVILFTYFASKIPALQRLLSAWFFVSVLFIVIVAVTRLAPSLYRLALFLPSQQARPAVVWSAFAIAVLAIVGVSISRWERSSWPTPVLVTALLSLLVIATVLLIHVGFAVAGIPFRFV